jgi:5-methylcytosine-specific restriction endonuclease McrA
MAVLPDGQYFGSQCKRGHVGRRYRKTHNCVDCDNERHGRLRAASPDVVRDRHRRSYEKNREKILDWKAKYWRENREQWRAYCRNRRARIAGAEGRHTDKEIDEIRALQRDKCGYCHTPLRRGGHVDHINPIAAGGSNDRRNLQLLCEPCNKAKGSMPPEVFATRIGRLV